MKTRMSIMVLMAALLIAGPAFAELVQGQVTAINPEDNSLTIQRMKTSGEQEQIDLNVPQNAEFRGMQSIQDVEVGDEIRAEANKPALGMGAWEAKWISKDEAGVGASARTGAANQPGMASNTADLNASGSARGSATAGSGTGTAYNQTAGGQTGAAAGSSRDAGSAGSGTGGGSAAF